MKDEKTTVELPSLKCAKGLRRQLQNLGSYWSCWAFSPTIHLEKRPLPTLNCHKKGEKRNDWPSSEMSCHVAPQAVPCFLLALVLWLDRGSSQSQSSRMGRPGQALSNPWTKNLNPLDNSGSSNSTAGQPEQNHWQSHGCSSVVFPHLHVK